MSETQHIEDMVQEVAERADEVAARSEAIETLTKESIIADNAKFRRRNGVLVALVSLLLILQLIQTGRELFVIGPQRDDIETVVQILEECTTPGSDEPTPEDPSTGHECFDDGQARTAEAIAAIVDADNNGKVDTQEILNFLKQFEPFLSVDVDEGS